MRLVAGNTGFGIYKEWLPEDHLIDVKQVPELRRLSLSEVGLPIPPQESAVQTIPPAAIPHRLRQIRQVAGNICYGIYKGCLPRDVSLGLKQVLEVQGPSI